jgi:hypothetical protein
LINILKAFYKYLISFFKTNWAIEDYPLRCRIQKITDENFRWLVQVINWWVLCGLGKTKEIAMNDLKNNFGSLVKTKRHKPRPGVKVPIEFASRKKLETYNELPDDFLEKILGIKKSSPVFASDESSLWDFTGNDTLNKYYDKIENIYKLDLRYIKDGNILEILEKIKKKL